MAQESIIRSERGDVKLVWLDPEMLVDHRSGIDFRLAVADLVTGIMRSNMTAAEVDVLKAAVWQHGKD